MNNEDRSLPEGWTTARLLEVGSWSTGGTPSRKQAAYFGGSIPWVKSGDLCDGLVESTEETLTNEGLDNSAAKVVPAGAVLMALYGATIGKLGVLGIAAATNQACAACHINGAIASPWFLFYFLLSQRQQLIESGQGGAQPNLTNEIVRNWNIDFPPLREQTRMVARIDQLLIRVNTARERVEVAARLLGFDMIVKGVSPITNAILAKAFRGELVATEAELARAEGRDYEPASALLERIHAERAAKPAPKRSRQSKLVCA